MRGVFFVWAFVSLVLLVQLQPSDAVLTRIRYNETYASTKFARCMDGTPGTFFGQPGTGSGLNKWIIYLQGGGWCFNEANCRGRSGGELGSSNSYPATISLGGMLSDSTTTNPDFANWNRVYLPYCSGDLHTGTRQTNSSETWGLYFAGHHLFLAALDMLDESFRLRSATEIILAGGSAGAVGSWIHAESLASRYPSARVVNLPNAGYFTFEQLYPAGDLIDRAAFLRNMSSVWSSFLPNSCSSRISNASDKWTCLLTGTSITNLPVPTFWIHAILDTNLMGAQLGFPGFSSQTNNNVTVAWLRQLYISRLSKFQTQMFSRQTDAWWVTSALFHLIDENTDCQRQNVTWLQTFSNWYFNRNGLQKVFDECGVEQSLAIYAAGSVTESTSCAGAKRCVPQSLMTPQSSPSVVTPNASVTGRPASSASHNVVETLSFVILCLMMLFLLM